MFSHKALTHKGSAVLTLRSACLAQPAENQAPGGFQRCEWREQLLNSTECKRMQNCSVQPLKTLSMGLQLKILLIMKSYILQQGVTFPMLCFKMA